MPAKSEHTESGRPLTRTQSFEATRTLKIGWISKERSHQTDMPMEKFLSNYEPLLTTAAVARWLGVSTRAICLWAECKELPAIKIGRQWRFRKEELSEWLQTSKADRNKIEPARP
jgi:excisionase family DNA binding protein